MNNLIEERDERTKRRKKYKRRIDKEYNLAYKDEEKMTLSATGTMTLANKKIRLLDEGAVVGDDYVDFIIRKGTLEKYLNGENKYLPNIDPDKTYTVNLGHMDFATFPFIIGEWTAKDLALVDIGDERKGIDVKVRLDNKSVFVQELKRQPYDIGVSSEFYYHVDWEATQDIGILVIDEVMIFAYGLVGECGNVNSSGLELSANMGEGIMPNIDIETEVAELEDTNVTELSADEEEEVTEVTEETTLVTEETEEEVDEVEEAEEEDTSETEEEADTNGEEVGNEETAEDGDEVEDEEADEMETALANVEEIVAENARLKATVETLESENAALKETNRRLQKKLKAEKDKKEKFIDSIKNVSVQLLPNEGNDPVKPTDEVIARRNYLNGDGFGE